MSKDFLSSEMKEVSLRLMEGLHCPRSLMVAILIRYNEGEQIAKLDCDPDAYLTADDYLDAAQATSLLKKLEYTVPGVDRKLTAIEKWKWAERECYKTNERLYELIDSRATSYGGQPINDALRDFLLRARKIIADVIGQGPGPDWEIPGRFGPGATMSDGSLRTTVPHKLSSEPTLTIGAVGYAFPWLETAWARATADIGHGLSFVRGNSHFTVPKTSLTHRSCAKEPSLNGFYQLGLGRILRRKLKRRGIDLDDGQRIHQRMAQVGSLTDEFATIDLSSASDTVSYNLVKLLLPHAWFEALDSVRSPATYLNGAWWRLEKFSSMGNGYTFELETLLFFAIAQAVNDECPWTFVYGDDIIVRKEWSKPLLAALKFFGFTPNTRKTFISGNFRESCGGDFFRGVSVRPHFVKEDPNEPQDYISLANGLRRMALNNGQTSGRFARLRHSWFRCLDNLPVTVRCCRGPEALGDIVIHDGENRWTARWRRCIRYLRVYRPATYRRVGFDRFGPEVQMASALYGVSLYPHKTRKGTPESSDSRGVIPRDGVLGYKVGWVPFS